MSDVIGEPFTDPGTTLVDFADEVLVVCPACGGCATIVAWPSLGSRSATEQRKTFHRMFKSRRLVCSACGKHEDWAGRSVAVGSESDPWFGQPLWLRTMVRGHVMWAWNARHLDLLEQVAKARVRKRAASGHGESTLVSVLPRWFKARQNREAIIAGLAHLRSRLPGSQR